MKGIDRERLIETKVEKINRQKEKETKRKAERQTEYLIGKRKKIARKL